jgi:hypothetical protein
MSRYTLVADVKILSPDQNAPKRAFVWDASDDWEEPYSYRITPVRDHLNGPMCDIMEISGSNSSTYMRNGMITVGFTITKNQLAGESDDMTRLQSIVKAADTITVAELDEYRQAARTWAKTKTSPTISDYFTMHLTHDRVSVRTSMTDYGAGLVTSDSVSVFESRAGFHAVRVTTEHDGTIVIWSVPTTRRVTSFKRTIRPGEISEFESAVQQLAPAVTSSTIRTWIRNAAKPR